jgi:hypothetical protein
MEYDKDDECEGIEFRITDSVNVPLHSTGWAIITMHDEGAEDEACVAAALMHELYMRSKKRRQCDPGWTEFPRVFLVTVDQPKPVHVWSNYAI